MIENIHIKNFKSLKDIELEPKKLTVLMGPNGSGKSSILQAIAFLPQLKDQITFDGDFVKLNSLKDIVYKKNLSNEISIEVTFKLNEKEFESIYQKIVGSPYSTFDFSSVRACFSINLGENKRPRPSLSLFTKDNKLIAKRIYYAGGNYHVYYNSQISVDPESGGNVDEIWTWRFSKQPSTAKAHEVVADTVKDIISEKILNNLYYLNPSRKIDDRLEEITDREVTRITPEGKNTLALLIYTKVNQEIQFGKIAKWMKEFNISEIYSNLDRKWAKVAFGDEKLYTKVDAPELGFGSNQLFPVIVQMFACKPGSVLMVEEPEMSLHAAAQVKLPYLFSDVLDENKQIIITSHSIFLPLAIGKAVRDKKCNLSREDIQIFELEKDTKGTKKNTLSVNEVGNIENWISTVAKVEDELYRDWAMSLPEEN